MVKTAKKITDMDSNKIYKNNLQYNIRKYREIKGLSQIQLAEVSGLDKSTIAEIERKSDHNIKLETLEKLMVVLGDENLLDDYCRFILNQEKEVKELIDKFGKEYLCNTLGVHRSTVERWGSGKYQVKREMFQVIKCIT